jgi:hypothetical protein
MSYLSILADELKRKLSERPGHSASPVTDQPEKTGKSHEKEK